MRSVNPARREVRVTPAPGAANAFSALELVELDLIDGNRLRCRVAGVRDEAGGKILTLSPGVPRETVARMKGSTLSAEVEVAAEGYPVEELNGLTVLDEAGSELGTVTAVYTAGGSEAVEITAPDGSTLLLPVIEQVIASVNIERGEIVVKDIEPYAVEED